MPFGKKSIKISIITAALIAPALAIAKANDVSFQYNAHELQTAGGLESLYNRIETKARLSCSRFGVRPLYVRKSEAECTLNMVDDVVSLIGNASLNAVHARAIANDRYALND